MTNVTFVKNWKLMEKGREHKREFLYMLLIIN